MSKLGITLLIFVASSYAGISSNSFLNSNDRLHGKRVLLEGFSSTDVGSIHYAAVGLKILGETLPSSQVQCQNVIKASSDSKVQPEAIYHAAKAFKSIGNCPQPLPVLNIVKFLQNVIEKEANLQELYYSIEALTALGQKPTDSAKLLKASQALLKKSDSLANLGYFFHICANLGNDGAAAAFTRIEDALVQADEVDGTLLQFEGGLSTTALILSGIFKVGNIVNKQLPLSNEQAVKFANYILSRTSVQTPKGVANILLTLQNFASNKYQVPIAITLAGSERITIENAKLNVKVCDVLGNDIGPVIVTADSVTRVPGEIVILSKKNLQPTSDKTIWSLDLAEGRPEKGMYMVTVSATLTKSDARFPSTADAVFIINALTTAVIDFVDVGIVDADQATQSKLSRVHYPKSTDQVLDGDAHQKLQMRFFIKDKAGGKAITVHQAFVRFYRPENFNSVVFIAEPDSSNNYRVDLDLGSKAGDFGQVSGIYELELIIGDPLISNSLSWKIGKVNLKFSSEPKTVDSECPYKPKPEIQHMFREPEKRPARVVSDLFSVLAAVPLVVLLILWARLRVNLSNLSFSLWTLGFHLGLAGIFALFGLFWLRLNMFETIRYLVAVGAVTFISGNKMLSGISRSKK